MNKSSLSGRHANLPQFPTRVFLQARDAEKRAKKKSDIPIPMVRDLPGYERDYLPVFRENTTYIRGRGEQLTHQGTHLDVQLLPKARLSDASKCHWLYQESTAERLEPAIYYMLECVLGRQVYSQAIICVSLSPQERSAHVIKRGIRGQGDSTPKVQQ